MMATAGSFRAKAEQRKHARKQFHWRATIIFDTEPPRSCTVTDVSESGARLKIDKPDALPEKFVLLLTSSGQARRLCRVIWRTRKEAGVKFLAAG
jgi:PilZ domain